MKVAPRVLTVVIRDPAPIVFMQEPVGHRSVRIELTDQQVDQLRLRKVGTDRGNDVFEEVALCFLEDPAPEGGS